MSGNMGITFRVMINSISDGIYICNSQGYCIAHNDAFLRITGIPIDVVGRHVKTLIDDNLISDSATLEVIRSGQRVSKVISYPSGCEALVTGNPSFDEEGNLINVVCEVRDLSELSTLKDELKYSNQLNKQYREILKNYDPTSVNSSQKITTRDPKMRSILDELPRIGDSDATVLIHGESGVGKGLIASLLHEHSNRSIKGKFIKVDCSAIPSSLIESELFGYEGGAFTGARREGKAGLLDKANHGTAFLDEIGELPLFLQVKLLSVLQDHKILRVGGNTPLSMDIRFVCATNRDLEKMVDEGTFRKDLFYRLNVIPVVIPPLRERKEDIFMLTLSFLDKFCQKYHRSLSFVPEAMDSLYEYSWPGNVRELENVVERLVVLSQTGLIEKADLPEKIRRANQAVVLPEIDLIRRKERKIIPLKAAVAATERQSIERALQQNINLGSAAQALSIDISTLLRKCKKLGITRAAASAEMR
ncbi:sigma-54 interaction domain-containing protein [Desulfosporosinus metallidurans]|uniref:Response regulator of zinc sigma-54-dependent two-component system n=1 Tax=Desulfosporosinus metallidurans TaxID=1888891 RepID=A0A1Q8QR77_9FIRM|nr:sigma 54-interacting transcriptional regulator [Desulfosporosinus metallidurans]OLN29802.1 Response regulator of zinc sigma-54-dependent two-component system [Desulfosporosinus metallidurans]